MVRASTNEPPEDKKEAAKRKPAIKKKAVMTGVWPCKINGCNKQFAREADLKRHQRTTKLHSLPGFACPQCDATFTRTDALRRHQKSRHNGIIIEASEDAKDGADDDAESSESRSKSRSATPSSKGKERAAGLHSASNHPNPAGPSSYYRQHTATTSAYIPRPPIMDPQYAQIGLPTSATRLNLATNWGYPQPWSDGASGHAGPVSYQTMPPMFYYPHYRPNGSAVQLPDQQPQPENDQRQDAQDGPTNATRPGTSSPNPHTSDTALPESETTRKDPTNPTTHLPEIPSIDPALDSDNTTLTEQQVLEITHAAMKAVLEAEAGTSSRTTSNVGSASPFSQTGNDTNGDAADDAGDNNIGPQPPEEKRDTIHVYGGTLKRPEPMAHMLTEDGEPMLNPAELLTQESLASPPPS